MGVRRLTGMNSEAISTDTQSAMENTAPQALRSVKNPGVVGSFHSSFPVADTGSRLNSGALVALQSNIAQQAFLN